MVVKFDPGFAQYTTILSVNLEYIYANISKFRNLGQKKQQFKMYYTKILKIVENNVAFCLGCLLWAVYIKSIGPEEIINNPCLGDIYDEKDAIEEIDFSKNYFIQLKKDVKYYLGLDYSVNSQYLDILDLYKDFLTINKGFVNTKSTDDLLLPKNLKQPSNIDIIKEKIDEVIKTGNLVDLFEIYGIII